MTRFTVKDPDHLRQVSESLAGIKKACDCTYFRLLQAHGEPDTFLAIMEFPSMADIYTYGKHLARLNVLENAGILDRRQEFYKDPVGLDASLSIPARLDALG